MHNILGIAAGFVGAGLKKKNEERGMATKLRYILAIVAGIIIARLKQKKKETGEQILSCAIYSPLPPELSLQTSRIQTEWRGY